MKNRKKYISIIKEYSGPLESIPTGLEDRGEIKDSIKAIFFDIYGTLFISGSGDISTSGGKNYPESLGEAFAGLLKRYGIEESPGNVYRRYIKTVELIHQELKSRGVDHPEVKIEKVWMRVLGLSKREARTFSVEYEVIANPVWPMPHLKATLDHFRKRGLLMGLISNAQFYTPLLFDALLDISCCRAGFRRRLCIFSYKYGYAKPSTFLFDLARKRLDKMSVLPRNSLYVGNDMLNDMVPASKCGFHTALFAGDSRSLRLRTDDKQCSKIIPDLIVTSLNNLTEIINTDN